MDAVDRPSAPTGLPSAPEPTRWTRRSFAALLAGGLLTGGLAGGALTLGSAPQSFEVDQLAPDEIDAATPSFPRAELGTHVEDAKACRVPLLFVTLVPRNGSTGFVRIRSGDYWTPVIHLGPGPIRVALPFPSPYPSGIGALQVEGEDAAFDLYLHPGWVGRTLQGTAAVNIWWRVKAPC